jgi:V8-like Glu-specific endopeptidase
MKRILFLFLTMSTFQISYGQVETRYYPEGDAFEQIKIISEYTKANKTIVFPPFDVQKLIEEDELIKELDVPFRFGKGFDTEISLADGEWTKVENGRLWSMGFISEGAYSINFVFDGFYLSDSAKLYVANTDGTMLYGPVTSKQNTKNGYFLTDLVQGDEVIVYLYEPDLEKGNSRLSIKRVVHAYKNFFSEINGNLGSSASCNFDIACFPSWDTESDAVALVLLSDGRELCSGSLLMTAGQTFEPYFLSAFHCIDVGDPDIYLDDDELDGILETYEISNAENWMFKFQYKMTSCSGSSATSGISYNSADFKAAWDSTDFALMEMGASPLGDGRFSWLGWDRSGNIPTEVTCIHHPAGDVMKYSYDSEVPTLVENNTHWFVDDWDIGTTEKGSSGSPLFDQNKRVIGQDHKGDSYSACDSRKGTFFGSFHRSWTGGGTISTSLGFWLDPDSSGIDTTNTTRSPYITGPSILCSSGGTYRIFNVPAGASITWSSSNGLARTTTQGLDTCIFIATNSGTTGWVSATVTNNGNNISLPHKTMWLGGVPSPEVYANNATLTGYDWYTVVLNTSNVYFYLVPDPAGSPIYPDTWDVDGDSYWYTNGSFLEFFPNIVGENIVAGYRQNACGFNGTYFTIEVVASKSSEDAEEISFKLSPNPANEYVNLKLELPDGEKMVDSYRVDYIDSYSRNVKQVILSGLENSVNIQDLPSGYYVVMLRYNGEVYSNKLIVE